MMRKRFWDRIAVAAALGVATAAFFVGGQQPARAQIPQGDAPTDKEVLESIRKGVHFLLNELAQKTPANNFESKFNAD